MYSFSNLTNGIDPAANLIAIGSTLYGTAAQGGPYGGDYGTIFSLDATGEEVMHSFEGGPDGWDSTSSLINVGGILYGTTARGGSSNCSSPGCGTVFSINPTTDDYSVVYSFQGGSDGEGPVAGLINVDGTLYGTTSGISTTNCSEFPCGTVFSVNPTTGVEKVVYTFQGGSEGANPSSNLIYFDGLLYGTTAQGGATTNCGGASGCGTVFAVNPVTGAEKNLHSFGQGSTDGEYPRAGLTRVGDTLYGTTTFGGAFSEGTLFAVTP